jgi:hypothetical protein
MNAGAASVTPRLRRDAKAGVPKTGRGLKARPYEGDNAERAAEVPYRRNTGTGLRGKVLYFCNTDLGVACE